MNASSVDLSKFTSPLLIPLPPSPPPKVRIPSRKPNGWISSVPRFSSGRFTSLIEERRVSNADQQRSASDVCIQRGSTSTRDGSGGREREVSAGTERTLVDQEEAAPIDTYREQREEDSAEDGSCSRRSRGPGGTSSGGGRRVSGTMQFALLPPSPSGRQPVRQSLDGRLSATGGHLPQDVAHHLDEIGPPFTAISDLDSETIITPLPHVQDIHDNPAPVHIVDPHGSYTYNDDVDHVTGLDSNEDAGGDFQPDQSFRSVLEISDSDGGDDEGELERPEWLDEVLAEREADEEWMGYVRSQLNALFPDFNTEEQQFIEGDQPGSDEVGIISGSHPGYLTTLPPQPYLRSGSYGQSPAFDGTMTSALSLRDPVQAGRHAADHLPGVREEMGSLREEIERLRGVVGGLAEGLGKSRQQEGYKKETQPTGPITVRKELSFQEEKGGADAASKHNEGEAKNVEQLLIKNADQVISLLKAIQGLQYPGQEMTTLELLQRDNLLKLQTGVKAGK